MNSGHTASFKIGVWKVQDFGHFELSPNVCYFQGLKSKLQGGEKSAELEKEHECCVATSTRIKFYKRFLSLLLLFGKEKVRTRSTL